MFDNSYLSLLPRPDNSVSNGELTALGAAADCMKRREIACACSGRGYLDTELPYAATSAPC
jgi:hypothetical protein